MSLCSPVWEAEQWFATLSAWRRASGIPEWSQGRMHMAIRPQGEKASGVTYKTSFFCVNASCQMWFCEHLKPACLEPLALLRANWKNLFWWKKEEQILGPTSVKVLLFRGGLLGAWPDFVQHHSSWTHERSQEWMIEKVSEWMNVCMCARVSSPSLSLCLSVSLSLSLSVYLSVCLCLSLSLSLYISLSLSLSMSLSMCLSLSLSLCAALFSLSVSFSQCILQLSWDSPLLSNCM